MTDKKIDIDINFNVENGDLEVASESLQSLTDSANELNTAMDDISTENIENINGDGLENASESAEELSESLDQASQSSDNLSESMGILEGGMLLSVGEQLSSMGTGAEGMAQQMNTASINVGQLATNVGMAEPQMVSLINNISNATFPQSEAMAYVGALQQMGVSADKLGDSATNMDRINDATGMGYAKVMELTQGLRSVGVEADNLPSSFNAISFAQANVNGGAETLSQVFKRQASTINEYGLSVDQTVLIMQKLSEQGVQGMKMGSELSKVLKDNNGDISAVEKALGMQSGALANANQVTGQYQGQLQQLADEEAEHKTLQDQMGAMWDDISLSLSGVLSPMGSMVGLMGQIGSVGMSVMGIRQLASGIGGLTTAINIMRNAESLSAGIKTVLATAFGIETVAEEGNAIAKTSAIGPTMGLAIAENSLLLPLLLLVGAILAVVGVLWYLYNTNETVRNAIDGFVNSLRGVLDWIMQIGSIIMEALNQAWITIQNWFNSLTNLTPQKVTEILLGIVTALNPLAGLIAGQLSKVLPVFITQATSWLTNTVAKANAIVTGVYNALVTMPDKITSALSGVTSALTKPFSDAWNMINDTIGWISDGIHQISGGFLGFEGFEGTVGFEGFGNETLNTSIANSSAKSSNTINQTFNNTFNGIIEQEAGDYIVDTLGRYVKKQNLIRGV